MNLPCAPADLPSFSHSRPEIRDGMNKPINKDYYYIDFHASIDAIKYRVYHLTEKVKELYKVTTEKKDLYCPQCRAQWTTLEAMDKSTPMGFECHRCGGMLEPQEREEGQSTGHEKQSRLMSQLDGLISMLRKIDLQDIPSNDFETAMSLTVPVERERNLNPLRPFLPGDNKGGLTAVKGITPTTVALDVNVMESADKTAADKAEEAKKKANLAQNELPVWHTTSTVTGEKVATTNKDAQHNMNGTSLVKDEEEDKKDGTIENDELKAYYAQLAEEREKEAKEDREVDDSDDDDDDFEDVDVANSDGGSPSDTSPLKGLNGTGEQQRKEKDKNSDSESSAPGTNVSTPAIGSFDDVEGPTSKRVKFESPAKPSTNGETAAASQADKDSDEDDEVEFEDV